MILRRDFLKAVTIAAGAAALPAFRVRGEEPGATSAPDQPVLGGSQQAPGGERVGDMLYRTLGSTGERVSALGLGGHHIGRLKKEKDSIELIRAGIDQGITFMDNCWDYHDGRSEELMGKALLDGYRGKVFLMTKIDGRTKKAAAEQIDESLRRLKTDRIDIMQHHEIIRMEDPDRIFGAGGAQEAMLEARQAGKIRYIGFTGHKDPTVHLRMLDMAREHGFQFATVQMPLNAMDAHFRSFEQNVLPRLVREGVGVLGMKSMGDGLLLESKVVAPEECLRYALSLPTSVVISGIDSMDVLRQNLGVVKNFQPLGPEDRSALLARTAAAAATGVHEQFKTSNRFDGTAKNPAWLG
jgi:aryl-alcohol dehydrogenase-like predicted oxidoreductase